MGFFRAFTKYEFISVAGKQYINIIVLTTILFVSIFTVIFSQALQDYLKKKMDSPFVKFITIDNEKNETSDKRVEANIITLNKDTAHYKINKIFPVRTGYISLNARQNSKVLNSVKFRIADDDPFCDFLLNSNSQEMESNFLTNRNVARKILNSDSSWGVIISEDLMLRLNYDTSNLNFIDIDFATSDGINQPIIRKVPLPVLGVVHQLPDKVDLLVSKDLGISLRNIDLVNHPLLIEKEYQNHYLKLMVDKSEKKKFENMGFYKCTESNSKQLIMQKDNVDSNFISVFIGKLNVNGYKRLYNYFIDKDLNQIQEDNFEKYTVYFNSLDSVRSFQSYLLQQNLYLDIDVVQSKENFNKLNKTIIIILGGLILFSMYCIVLYTTNLVNNHIQKNTKNLGTLKSFGMSNNMIIKVYFTISSFLIGISFTIALIISFIFSKVGINPLIKSIKITDYGEKLNNIRMVSIEYCIVFIIITFSLVYFNLRKTLKGKTPGDLIYNR